MLKKPWCLSKPAASDVIGKKQPNRSFKIVLQIRHKSELWQVRDCCQKLIINQTLFSRTFLQLESHFSTKNNAPLSPINSNSDVRVERIKHAILFLISFCLLFNVHNYFIFCVGISNLVR